MKKFLQGSGLPNEAIAAIQHLVGGAGYDIDNPGALSIGMTAALATLRVCDALQVRRAPPGSRVGRNEPCPCGSGKKHKKCCLKTGGGSPAAPGYDPGDPLERADLVPAIFDPGALARDLDGLEALFVADAGLRGVRFSPDKMVSFVMAESAEDEPAPPAHEEEDEGLAGEARVARYLAEVEGAEALGRVDRALLRAAPDCVASDQDLRSLAVGVALWEMEEDTDPAGSEAPNPLLSLLFWLTLRETAAGFSGLDDEVRALIPDGVGAACERAESLTLGAGLQRILGAQRDPLLNGPGPAGKAAHRELIERIAEGAFPVGLPLLSTLPALVRVSILDLDEPRREEFLGGLRAGADALGVEDAELFDQAMDAWVESHRSSAAREDLAAITAVRMYTAAGTLGPFAPALVVAAVNHRNFFSLRGEPEVPASPVTEPADLFSQAYLEACGEFLHDHGLPEMAIRTWELCELLGPVPEAVAEKLAAAEPAV